MAPIKPPLVKPNKSATPVCTCLMLRKAARRVSQIYDHCLEPYGLTITQYGLLGHVKSLDGIGIGALAEKLVMDPTTLTRNIRPLLKTSLLVLVADPSDRRHRRLHLTELGRDAFANARVGWAAAQKQIATALGEPDGSHLAVTIGKLLHALAA